MINDILYRLKFIIRYSNMPRVRDESVAEHSFFVSAICIEMLHNYPEADVGKVLMMANIHDWAEADIDDIAHNVKRDYPEVGAALKLAEESAMNKYHKNIVSAYREYEECQTLEARIVKYADIQQCIQYLTTEIKLGNEFMLPLLDESYTQLKSFQIEGTPKQLRMEELC